jgi:hypothetical protein
LEGCLNAIDGPDFNVYRRGVVIGKYFRTLIIVAMLALVAGLTSTATPARAQPTGSSCDIYGYYGTPCVAAYSTVRALYTGYDGPLYQVQRASDGATADIGLLTTGGYVNASEQDSFCAGTSCTITEIYDQSPEHNNLTIEGGGGAAPGADHGANATALPITVAGHEAYGVEFPTGTGYRDDNTRGVAVNGQPEGMYMVASGIHVNSGCCFDFGNAEANNRDNGAGHMDSVNLSTVCISPCVGRGPWVEADMENGLFMGGNGSNTANTGDGYNFVTAMLKNNGQTTYELQGGSAQAGGLTDFYSGPLPSGYAPMHQEGAVLLGTGGDNSNWDVGAFFEGVMTQGYPSDTADAAVQADIVSVGYAGSSTGVNTPVGTVTNASGKCLDVAGDDTGVDLTHVDISTCAASEQDQHWVHNSDDSLETLGRCLDIDGNGTAPGTLVELYDCNGVGGQKWLQEPNGALFNPQSGLCLDDPNDNTTDGTQLQIWYCNGTAAQVWHVNGGNPIVQTSSGQCVDVIGDDTGGQGTPIDLWNCQSYAADQHWTLNAAGELGTLGRCLSIIGNSSAQGTNVDIETCNGEGGQVWRQQPDGTLINPMSGLCLDDPNDVTTNGTDLRIWSCNGSAAQQFQIYDAGYYAPAGEINMAGGTSECVDVYGNDTGGNLAKVDVWNCVPYAQDMHWTHNADGSLETLGRCLDIDGNGTAVGTLVELYDCNGVGGQKWIQQANGSLLNPQSGLCLDDPNGDLANGTQLRIWTCNGTPAQEFNVTGGNPIAAPGGQCVDVIGDDVGTSGTPVNLWNCQPYSIDQHWTQTSSGQLKSLGLCLSVIGNSTAAGTDVDIETCNGEGGQVWQQQSNGSMLNPASGLCLDDPNGVTTNGTPLRIWPCNGLSPQVFTIGA